jgi:hypothetical protein
VNFDLLLALSSFQTGVASQFVLLNCVEPRAVFVSRAGCSKSLQRNVLCLCLIGWMFGCTKGRKVVLRNYLLATGKTKYLFGLFTVFIAAFTAGI